MKKVPTLLPNTSFCFINRIMNMMVIIFLVVSFPLTACSMEKNINFQSLENRLINDKDAHFTEAQIHGIYNNPGAFFDIKGVASYFRHQESKLNYDQFLSSKSIKRASAYMHNHYAALLKAEIDYGVDKEAITAIMLVETRFGSYVGNRPVLCILSTMAALKDKTIRDQFWEKIPPKNRITHEAYEKKAVRKADWAYKELVAFLKYVQREGMDPYNITGSYAGAMGLAQFMPSNVMILAEDGDKDGSVNMFHDEDAIASIANYLKHYGWKPGISREEAGKVVYHYNHSPYYVKTVLNIIDKLKS